MEDQILTPHFRLSEFTRSAIAECNRIDNTIPSSLIPNLQNLCQEVLEPLRQHFGVPIIISSGYRSPELNRLVGGATNSQHLTGEAADIICDDVVKLRQWFVWLIDNSRFDQAIYETRNSTHWIHISLCIDETNNRQHAFCIKK